MSGDNRVKGKKVLKMLHVEDAETDAELILRELKRYGLSVECTRVWTEQSFVKALENITPDVILSDGGMPTFSGPRALALARELAPRTPFIFVSGSSRPEDEKNALKQGAADYLLKDDLALLGAAVERAVKETTNGGGPMNVE